MDLDGCVAGWSILGGIDVGKAWTDRVVAGFDGVKPGGLDVKAGGGVEVSDKGDDAEEVVGVDGSRGCSVSTNELEWMGVWIVFRAEREAA